MKKLNQLTLILIISFCIGNVSNAQVTGKEVQMELTPQEYLDYHKENGIPFNEDTFFDDHSSNVTITEMMYEVDELMNKSQSLVVSQAMMDCNEGFYDGFEDGTHLPEWTNPNNNHTTSVISTDPAEGTYSLFNRGWSNHSRGLVRTFNAFQPKEISYWIKPTSQDGASNYLVIGENTVSNNGIIFFYFTSSGNFRFFNGGGLNIPVAADSWYKIELKDLDWTNRHFDIYIDDILIQSDFAFRASSNNVSEVHLYNLSSSSQIGQYDSIIIGCDELIVVPTLSQWGLIILALILMSIGLLYIRMRSKRFYI